MPETILVLTNAHDPTGARLTSAIAKRGISALRFDTSEFPLDATLDASFANGHWCGLLTCKQGKVALEDIKSIWYHRPYHYRVNEELPGPYKDFAEEEAKKGFGGILRGLNCFWISHPDIIRAASFKPLQLRLAQEIGFKTPRTLITNSPEALHRFYTECDGLIITKALSNGFIAVGGDEYHAVYTSQVSPEILNYASNVRHTATMFQELIPKRLELRVTVIGETVIAVAIDSQQSERTRLDWRRWYPDLIYSPFDLALEVKQQCLHLLHALNLNYGCIDLILTPQDEIIFLEINPAGQYLWLETATGLPFTETLVDLLVKGNEHNGQSTWGLARATCQKN